MARIKKEIDMGGGYKLFLIIDDEIAVMTCNYAKVLQKIYFQGKQDQTRDVTFDYRHNSMIERFPGKNAQEIWNKLNYAVSIAHKQQEKIIDEGNKKVTKSNQENKE